MLPLEVIIYVEKKSLCITFLAVNSLLQSLVGVKNCIIYALDVVTIRYTNYNNFGLRKCAQELNSLNLKRIISKLNVLKFFAVQ